MSAVYQRGNARVEANLTPMIDVTFLLIVFFVLVSQIVEVEHVDLDPPRPEQPLSERLTDESRTVINLVPGPGGGIAAYRLGSREFPPGPAGLDALAARLAVHYRANPSVQVNLRADRGTHYRWVEPVLGAVTSAARQADVDVRHARLNLVIVRDH